MKVLFTHQFTRSSLLTVALFAALLGPLRADLPVHCERSQVYGEWRFTLDEDTFRPLMHDPKTTCGHGQPDQVDMLTDSSPWPPTYENAFEMSLFLIEPNKVGIVAASNGANNGG